MPAKNTNSKKEAGRLKKEAQANIKAEKEAGIQEEAAAKDWKRGANLKGAARSEASAVKADEAARKRKEKEDLLAAEEAELGPGGKVKTNKLSKKKGKKKGDDLDLLNLIAGAEKQTKAQKKKIATQKEREAEQTRARKEKEQNQQSADPLMANTNAMIGDAVGRDANVRAMEEANSGLEGALKTLNVRISGDDVKSRKALYKAYEEKMLPSIKQDYPGLRLTQYKDKIFNLWKKSRENPANQVE